MPEGDTIHYAANRIRPVLLGEVPDRVATPHPRFGKDRWPERLEGLEVTDVSAHGKHLFLRFGDELTVHSHLRMTGSWGVHRDGARWKRHPRRAWLQIHAKGHDIVQFDGPVLDLLAEPRRRFDHRLRALGPDILASELDEPRILRRLREDDPTRGFGDALLDQRIVAGIGNLWKSEGCFDVRIDPWRKTQDVSDSEVCELLRATRLRMQDSAKGGMQMRERHVYKLSRCPRCGGRVHNRGQGDDNRTTYWCPECQR